MQGFRRLRARRGLIEALGEQDRRLYRRAVRADPAVAGRASALLARAANRSALWAGIAVVVGLVDGRFGRRGALRGMLSVGVASAVASGIGKRLARRARPGPQDVSPHRLLVRLPDSPSFPSGHAASAFAFATGMSFERPDLAPPLYALAAAVAYSRIHTGVHFPSDVVAGAAIGTGAAFAVRRYWPVAPREPASAHPALLPPEVVPTPTGEGLVVAVNPAAGSSLPPDPARRLRRELPGAEVIEVDEGDDLREILVDACRRARAIGIAGGDGSTNVAAEVAHAEGKPLLVVPSGTLNNFAKDLGLRTLDDSIRAVGDGHGVAVDAGEVAGRVFLNVASIGAYVDFVDARERLEDRIGKWPAMVVALARVLRRADPLEVEIDGRPRRIWMAFFGNCTYRPPGFGPTWREDLHDGRLDVRIIDAARPLSRARLLAAVLTGSLAGSRVYEATFAREVRVRSANGPLRLSRDGETFEGPDEVTVRKVERSLTVFVPYEPSGSGAGAVCSEAVRR